VRLQPNESNRVFEFLEEHGLAQYAEAVLGSGFVEMESLLEADDADLKDLGLLRGHALKLKRHLCEYVRSLASGSDCEEGWAQASAAELSGQVACGTRLPRSMHSWQAHAAMAKPPVYQLEAAEAMKGDVRESWEVIQETGTEVVGEHLYKVFFELMPESMSCFPLEVRLKYREWTADESEEEDDLLTSAALRRLFAKVLNAIGGVVAGLQDSSKLVPLLTSLGRRHIGYGVNEAFWPALGTALNTTLSDLLGDGFTNEVENAWNVVYGFTSSIMIAGLRQAKMETALPIASVQNRGFRSQWSRATDGSSTTEEHASFEDGMLDDSDESPTCGDSSCRSVSECSFYSIYTPMTSEAPEAVC